MRPVTLRCPDVRERGGVRAMRVSVRLPASARGAPGASFPPLGIAVNPEFMREGSSLRDFAHPPMTLVGTDDPDTASLLETLYAGVDAPFVRTSVRTAEAVKYVCNAYH